MWCWSRGYGGGSGVLEKGVLAQGMLADALRVYRILVLMDPTRSLDKIEQLLCPQ